MRLLRQIVSFLMPLCYLRQYHAGGVEMVASEDADSVLSNDLKVLYGMIHWQQLLLNMRQARFEEALRIILDRHACPEGVRRLLPIAL
jgi:hypothetical protein